MSTRDIHEIIYQMFYCDLDKDTISRIIDKIIPEIVMWQQISLEYVYPIIVNIEVKKRYFALLDSWIRIF